MNQQNAMEILTETGRLCSYLIGKKIKLSMIRRTDHATPLYPQKLALTSPTSGGRSFGIVRSRTQYTEFNFTYVLN
jgi:hypothetical protein